MKKVLLFDLDDTLLWDKQSVDKALLKTCVELYPENPEALLASVRKTAPALYSTYPFYEFTQKIGINPFEGLWGTFHDETFSFPVMHEFIGDYQFKTWNTSLNSVGIFDEQMAHEAVEKFKNHRLHSPYLYESTIQVLEELAPAYRLGLLTNGAPSLQNTKLTLTPELRPYFEHIVISGEVGIGKPDSVPFQELLKRMQVTFEEAVMIGDNLKTDIQGAYTLGMESIWINHHQVEGPNSVQPTHTVSTLDEIVKILL